MPDHDGYPTEDELNIVRSFPIKLDNLDAMMGLVESIWHWPEYVGKNEQGLWVVSTGGWSGNEDIIRALGENTMFWTLYWIQSRRGGHYIFGRS